MELATTDITQESWTPLKPHFPLQKGKSVRNGTNGEKSSEAHEPALPHYSD